MAEIGVRPPSPDRPSGPGQGPSPMLEAAERSIKEPFVGVRTSAGRVEGLFELDRPGAATDEIATRARRFLDALDEDRREAALFDLESDAWRRWSNIHRNLMRHGAALKDCSPAVRDRALDLVASALSEEGFRSARDVMRLNDTLREITGRPDEFGEWFYWLSIFGEPSATEPWGFQFDGHHVNLNCFLAGEQLVLTPFFLGSEPVIAETGSHQGVSVLQGEESDAVALMACLTSEERQAAILGSELPREMFAGAFRDNFVLDYEGVAYDQLGDTAKDRLIALISRYVGRIRPLHAEAKMREVLQHLDATYFAWIGGTGADDVFYYRVHSPVILIEFDHQSGVVFDNDYPTRRHIHTVVRTPNGNDYGKDLLREHYARHPHPDFAAANPK
jgi:Protein of unknown function (DUF3500)